MNCVCVCERFTFPKQACSKSSCMFVLFQPSSNGHGLLTITRKTSRWMIGTKVDKSHKYLKHSISKFFVQETQRPFVSLIKEWEKYELGKRGSYKRSNLQTCELKHLSEKVFLSGVIWMNSFSIKQVSAPNTQRFQWFTIVTLFHCYFVPSLCVFSVRRYGVLAVYAVNLFDLLLIVFTGYIKNCNHFKQLVS